MPSGTSTSYQSTSLLRVTRPSAATPEASGIASSGTSPASGAVGSGRTISGGTRTSWIRVRIRASPLRDDGSIRVVRRRLEDPHGRWQLPPGGRLLGTGHRQADEPRPGRRGERERRDRPVVGAEEVPCPERGPRSQRRCDADLDVRGGGADAGSDAGGSTHCSSSMRAARSSLKPTTHWIGRRRPMIGRHGVGSSVSIPCTLMIESGCGVIQATWPPRAGSAMSRRAGSGVKPGVATTFHSPMETAPVVPL